MCRNVQETKFPQLSKFRGIYEFLKLNAYSRLMNGAARVAMSLFKLALGQVYSPKSRHYQYPEKAQRIYTASTGIAVLFTLRNPIVNTEDTL